MFNNDGITSHDSSIHFHQNTNEETVDCWSAPENPGVSSRSIGFTWNDGHRLAAESQIEEVHRAIEWIPFRVHHPVHRQLWLSWSQQGGTLKEVLQHHNHARAAVETLPCSVCEDIDWNGGRREIVIGLVGRSLRPRITTRNENPIQFFLLYRRNVLGEENFQGCSIFFTIKKKKVAHSAVRQICGNSRQLANRCAWSLIKKVF